MPSPSSLAIATSAVLRLLKEEISYQKELVDQEATIKIFQEKIAAGHTSEDGNDEFMLKQQQMAVQQTKAVFEPLKQRISDAVAKLEEQIALREDDSAAEKELEQARSVLVQAKAAESL